MNNKSYETLVAALNKAVEALYNVPEVGKTYDQQHSDTHMSATRAIQEALVQAEAELHDEQAAINQLLEEVDAHLDYEGDEDMEAAAEEVRKYFLGGQDPLAENPKLEVLEALGYDIDRDSDQPGMWIWMAPTDCCEISYQSAEEALDAAWEDAIGQTTAILGMSREQWDALSFDQQKEHVSSTLSNA